MPLLALDPDRVDVLAGVLRRQAGAAEESAARVRQALTMAELQAEVADRLEERSDHWRSAASHLNHSAGLARNHVLDVGWPTPGLSRQNQWALAGILRNGLPATAQAERDSDGGACGIPLSTEGTNIGDLGGTFDVERRAPFSVCEGSPEQMGRDALIRMIADTGTPMQIGQDEFEIIQHGDETFTIVLAGVTDLSSPDFGLSEENRTVRDVDRFAVRSAVDTTLETNAYARMVSRYAFDHLPPGANVMIVGHSYGADTAADLAADGQFNGPDGFNVTHVVAAAYHSEPQLAHLPDSTRVLVLQNELDMAIAAEHLLHDPNIAVQEFDEAARSLWNRDPQSLVHLAAGAEAVAETAQGAVGQAADAVWSLPDIGAAWWRGDRSQVVAHATDLLPELGVTEVNDVQTVAVFPGGVSGVGHHQDHYIDYLESADAPAVVAFFESIDAAGYTADGESSAVDVSVPS